MLNFYRHGLIAGITKYGFRLLFRFDLVGFALAPIPFHFNLDCRIASRGKELTVASLNYSFPPFIKIVILQPIRHGANA